MTSTLHYFTTGVNTSISCRWKLNNIYLPNNKLMTIWYCQVDFLQQKNREMEKKLQESTVCREEAEGKAIKLQARSHDLDLEVQDLQSMAKKLHSDKTIVVKTADKEMNEAKVRWPRSYTWKGL